MAAQDPHWKLLLVGTGEMEPEMRAAAAAAAGFFTAYMNMGNLRNQWRTRWVAASSIWIWLRRAAPAARCARSAGLALPSAGRFPATGVPSWISAREASRLPFKSSRYFASHPEKTVQAPLSAKTFTVILEGCRGRGVLVGEGLELRSETCVGRSTELENDVRYIFGRIGPLALGIIHAENDRLACRDRLLEIVLRGHDHEAQSGREYRDVVSAHQLRGVGRRGLEGGIISETDFTSRMSTSLKSQS